jgi:hypothetical protein
MSKAIKNRISLQAGLNISESDISWSVRNNAPYRYHVDLHHFPTEMLIEQVSDTALSHAKESCMIELTWRLKNWEEYQQSRVRNDL